MYLVAENHTDCEGSEVWEHQEWSKLPLLLFGPFGWSAFVCFYFSTGVVYCFIVCFSLICATESQERLISDTSWMWSYLCQWGRGALDQALGVFRHSVRNCHRRLLQTRQWTQNQLRRRSSHNQSTFRHIQNQFHSSEIIYNSFSRWHGDFHTGDWTQLETGDTWYHSTLLMSQQQLFSPQRNWNWWKTWKLSKLKWHEDQ